MRTTLRSWLLVLLAGPSLLSCIGPDDFVCFTDCWWGQTFVRLEPPLDEDGTLVLTVKAGWIDETCTVTLPLSEPALGCSGASGLEVWARDDDSSDLAGITLRHQPDEVRIEARRDGVVLFDQSAPVTVKTEGAECECRVGRATISTLR